MSTDHPMLFSPPMILALLREAKEPGTGKRQTRRIIKPQPTVRANGPWSWEGRNGGFVGSAGTHVEDFPESAAHWLRIQPGDRVWCRETWGGYHGAPNAEEFAGGVPVFYRADPEDFAAGIDRWRPSIHMPRWASRLTLYVSEVRVQRLQEISEADAQAEGVDEVGVETGHYDADGFPTEQGSYRCAYAELWEHLNGPGSWAENPWVACYSFKPVLGNIDSL